MGHIVSEKGLSKPQSYIDALTNFPRPTTVRDLSKFIGFINFQRKFVPKYSVIIKPLSRLTGQAKNVSLTWTKEMQRHLRGCVKKSRRTLCWLFSTTVRRQSTEIIHGRFWYWSQHMFTSAPGECLAPYAYASLAFSVGEINCSSLDRELAAKRWAVRTFRGLLYGVDFVLRTDHRPLVYLHNMRIVNLRLVAQLRI